MLPQAQALSAALLALVLLIGAYSDWRWRRLPNWLTLGGAALGLALGLALGGLEGGKESLLGWLLGCGLLFIPFALGGMGAGDVKLMGTVGAFKGVSFVFISFVYTAFIGAAVSIVLLALSGRLLPLLQGVFGWLWLAVKSIALYRMLPPLGGPKVKLAAGETGLAGKPKAATMPYGLAIAAGAILAMALGY